MKTDTDGFLGAAKGLARNPLGIIALFIALIYGFATLLLGAAAEKLVESERGPLIWFIVLFPVMVLTAFYRLVTNHHGKLYSPGDYKDDKSFLNTLPPITPQAPSLRDTRIDEEVEAIVGTSATEEESAPPEATPPSVPLESRAPSSRTLATERAGVRSEYIQAEQLALRKISSQLGTEVHRQVTIDQDRSTAFDGVAVSGNTMTFVEVKLLRRAFMPSAMVREALYRALIATERVRKDAPDLKFELIFAVVTAEMSKEDIQRAERQFLRLTQEAPITVKLQFFDVADLRREFPDIAASNY